MLGAGICGLAAAILLARDGHDVVVLERDAESIRSTPDEAWTSWRRGGVAQFRQPHFILARARHLLDTELPDVRDALLDAGALAFDMLSTMPLSVADRTRRPGDERFVTFTGRRPAFEHVFATTAAAQPRIEVRRGVAVSGLVTGASNAPGTPHVVGVRTASGERLDADLVVDAMGRRSPLPGWLTAIGALPLHEEIEDSGFIYYSRFFRGGRLPEPRTLLGTAVGSFSILTIPADRDTWSVTLFISSRDQPLKPLRFVDRWSAVLEACPLHAHWLDGEPITDVMPMSGFIDRYRRIAVDGKPAATGVALVADAAACTNPSLGRGVTLGLLHAIALRDVLRDGLDDPLGFALAWDAATEARLTPWYRAGVATDRARLAEMDALRKQRAPAAPSTPPAMAAAALRQAMRYDPDAFRAFMEIVGCLAAPSEIFARSGFLDRVLRIAGEHEEPPLPGPPRPKLLEMLA